MSRGKPGWVCQIKGAGKALVFHKEQEPEFKSIKKFYIHYMDDDYSPIIEDGKEKTGLVAADKLNIIGYLD